MTSQENASLRIVSRPDGGNGRGPTVTICSTCWSSDLSSDSYHNETWWTCNNCRVSNCEPKVILSLQRGDFPVKSRDEVNPEMVRLCALCNSDRLEDTGCQWDHATTCQNCKKIIYDYAAGIRSVPRFRYARGEYDVKSRNEVNPEMMTICALCNSDKLRDSGCQRDPSSTCDHCGKLIYNFSSGIRSVARFKYARGDYPVKRREDVNPEMITVCDLCNAKDCMVSNQCGTGWITSCLHCGRTCRGKDVKKHEWLAANGGVPAQPEIDLKNSTEHPLNMEAIPSGGASVTIVNTNTMSMGAAQGQGVGSVVLPSQRSFLVAHHPSLSPGSLDTAEGQDAYIAELQAYSAGLQAYSAELQAFSDAQLASAVPISPRSVGIAEGQRVLAQMGRDASIVPPLSLGSPETTERQEAARAALHVQQQLEQMEQMGRAVSLVPCPPPPTAPPMSPLEEDRSCGESSCAGSGAGEDIGSDDCVICLSVAPTHAIVPCGHQCVCEACAKELCRRRSMRACPVCRGDIQTTIRIFR